MNRLPPLTVWPQLPPRDNPNPSANYLQAFTPLKNNALTGLPVSGYHFGHLTLNNRVEPILEDRLMDIFIHSNYSQQPRDGFDLGSGHPVQRDANFYHGYIEDFNE